MTVSLKRQFGDLGEKAAAKYLQDLGYQIIEINFKNNLGRMVGEIDIIASDPKRKELVFVEVKTRELKKYGQTLPEENITYQKLKKMQKAANIYLWQKKLQMADFRFDAISIWLDLDSKEAKIKHISHL